jgi:hypothetical protein
LNEKWARLSTALPRPVPGRAEAARASAVS